MIEQPPRTRMEGGNNHLWAECDAEKRHLRHLHASPVAAKTNQNPRRRLQHHRRQTSPRFSFHQAAIRGWRFRRREIGAAVALLFAVACSRGEANSEGLFDQLKHRETDIHSPRHKGCITPSRLDFLASRRARRIRFKSPILPAIGNDVARKCELVPPALVALLSFAVGGRSGLARSLVSAGACCWSITRPWARAGTTIAMPSSA